MAEEIKLDTTRFDHAMADLARLSGKSVSKVIKSEASAILSKSMQKTGAASSKLITAKYTYRDPGPNPKTIPWVRLNGRRVTVRSVPKRKGGKANPQWNLLQNELARQKKQAKDRRGLSKATWMRIAKQAGLPALKNPPAYVRKAYALLPAAVRSVVSGKEVRGFRYHILVKNFSRTAMAPKSKKGPGGYHAFKSAFNGRRRYFERNLANGTFEAVDKILKKYPGLDAVKS